MSEQLTHIRQKKAILEMRSEILKTIREFFWERNFLEVETPHIVKLPGQEPYLSPVELTINDDKRAAQKAFLHTSPEYTMKKMLAAGFENIFFLGKTFRDYESFGGTHNPEFTMLEWYRVGASMFDLMEDVEALFNGLQEKMKNVPQSGIPICGTEFVFQRKSMKEVWMDTINVNLDEHLTQETMLSLCKKRGYKVEDNESYEDLFYRIFLNEIEPTFNIQHSALIIYNYPAPMAALAKLSESDPGYAERFEVYVNGMELANAFSELTDADEQRARLEEERELKKTLGKTVYDIDKDFIEAVGNMPKSAGIALGVDRLVQILLGENNIDNVLTLPMSKLFS